MGDLRNTPPPTIVGRVAQRIDEITDARSRGFPWPRIVQIVGAEVGINPDAKNAGRRLRAAYVGAVAAMERGRIKPSLPTPPLAPARPAPPATPTPTPASDLDLPNEDFFEKLKQKRRQ